MQIVPSVLCLRREALLLNKAMNLTFGTAGKADYTHMSLPKMVPKEPRGNRLMLLALRHSCTCESPGCWVAGLTGCFLSPRSCSLASPFNYSVPRYARRLRVN